MKHLLLLLGTAVLLASCNQTAPVTSSPTAAPETATTAPSPSDSVTATAPPAVATAPPAVAAPALAEAETVKASFRFKPAPDADNPSHPRTSAHLLLAGSKPQDIDLGKFSSKPDVVDAEKARQAGFPAGMLMGFRSYNAATGTSEDLAVLFADGHYVRIVQRRVDETATEPGEFKTSREVSLPPNTQVVAAQTANK